MSLDKIRNLLDDPRKEDLCLNDLIMSLAAMVNDAATLEFTVSNNKVLQKHKRDMREFRRLLAQYESRLRDEITPEIVAYLEGLPKGKRRGRPENVIEYNERRRKARENSK